jgi:hypothetical protein
VPYGSVPGLRILAFGRLPKANRLSGRWPTTPRSQLRDSAGFTPASLYREAIQLVAKYGR